MVGKMAPTDPLTQSIMEADADVAYFLGKHPKELAKITELPATPEKPKAPSKAPEPIKPLSGAGAANTSPLSEDKDTATWIKNRQKQVHGRRS